ncbi:LPD7 domain-containing protein [Pantoea sp. BAV 3049]|uniref:LPD7 domain-containing protein n=1 Tax=Pantoea sp. BAV 3049 TaxID=2654188 RepID=UPI00131C3DAD|nr:LPD7 domain-containing protein [Pantoea sp. BAV 3049]
MIIRYGGGNNGIAEYLESGRKADREYTRDELDHRYILDGNLQTTNKVIQSIEDKGQERYLHITLSFAEKEVSTETLKAITADYKKLFMNAFHDDEHAFYAEAHLPKIKNLINNKTGEFVERKPHIHVVIPRANLVTGKSLNPGGDITRSKTLEQLDAIQEYINNKYGLISPKDAVRVSDENYANVLSRVKGDLYRERNNDIKYEIYSRITNENVNSTEDFKNLLKNYGDIKVRNEGKKTEYFAVKFEGDAKYTNLKSPLFSRTFIEQRQLPLVKPTPAQIERNLNNWLNKTSHEIKHIFAKSEKLRNEYKSLNASDKAAFLRTRINDYDKQYKLDPKSVEGSRGRTGSHKFSPQSSSRFDRIKTRVGLPHMPKRGLVRGISGRGKPPESVSVLSHNEQHNLAERMETRQHSDEKMRRNSDRRLTERGLKTIELSSVLHESLYQKLNADVQKNEIHIMADIRRDIDPQRFLSAAAIKYNIKAEDHAVSHAKDGSPRFAVEKRNLNASDFLTKYLNLPWKDAKEFLLQTYSQQLENKPFEKTNTISKLDFEQSKQRFLSIKESNISLREAIRSKRANMYNELRELRKQIYSIPKENREVAKGLLVYKKLTTLERLRDFSAQGRNFISQYHKYWNEDKDNMKALDKLKDYLNNSDENGISQAENDFSLEKAVEAQRRLQELHKNNSRLKYLVMDKREDKIIYRDQKTEAPVFTDKGDFIVSGKNLTKEEIGVMLEYSQEKFGGVLKLSGSDEFKKQCAVVAAEKDMNIILRPEKYQSLMLEAKNEQAFSREQTTVVEKEQTVSQAEVEQSATDPQQSTVETKEIYLVSSTIAQNENEGFVFHSRDEAFDYYNSQIPAEIERFESGQSDFNNTLIVSKTVSVHELDQYENGKQGEFSKPYDIIADSFKDYEQSERGQSYKNYVLSDNEPISNVYFVKFNNDQLDAEPTGFTHLKHAVDWREVGSNINDVNKQDAVIYRVDEKIADQKGLSAAMSDAVRVPRHEIEKVQGRDVTEQDGQILNVIDEYQQKFTSEGLIFDRGEAEGELLQKDMTLDIASERLEQKFLLEKERQQEQELNSGLEH